MCGAAVASVCLGKGERSAVTVAALTHVGIDWGNYMYRREKGEGRRREGGGEREGERERERERFHNLSNPTNNKGMVSIGLVRTFSDQPSTYSHTCTCTSSQGIQLLPLPNWRLGYSSLQHSTLSLFE